MGKQLSLFTGESRNDTILNSMPGKKLLVADDSLTIQKVIRLALSNEGYEIQAVSDGNDAIQQLSLFKPDVVLIDVSLPAKSAFEVKREINQHQDLEEIRFVLMSSAFEKVDEAQSEEVHFHGFLTKPFDPAHLRQVLHDVLDQVSSRRAEKTTLLPSAHEPPPGPAGPHSLDKLAIFPPPPPMPASSNYSSDHFSPEFTSEFSPPPPPRFPSLPTTTPSESPQFHVTPPPPPGPIDGLWEPELPPDFPDFEEPLDVSIDGGREDFPIGPTINQPSAPSLPPPSLPPPPRMDQFPMPPEATGETDIQALTESTMRISSMDDYQWSVNEPMMKPMPKMLDRGGSNFDLGNDEPRMNLGIEEPPPFNLEQAYAPTPPPMHSLPPKPPTQKHSFVYDEPEVKNGSQAPGPLPISQDEIEELVRNEVKAILGKMTQSMLPNLAEKIIKEEIHRLLSE